LFENIDFSSGTKIIQEHKVVLGAATTIIFLSLLVKQLQRSDQCGKWLHEKYNVVGTSVDNYTNNCIKECPTPIQYALTPLKVVIQYLCNAIKRYVAMNETTIVGSVVAPVTGRVLDTVFVCPIPLLNFTSIGWMASGGILTKGYFDRNFEKIDEKLDGIEIKINKVDKKNIKQHTATQKKIGVVQSTINTVQNSVQELFCKINALSTGVGQIREQVGSVSEQVKTLFKELTGISQQVTLLQDKFEIKDKRDIAQYEDLKKRLGIVEALLQEKIASDKNLMLEVQGFKSLYQEDNKNLRKDLSATATQLSNQIGDVQKTLNGRLGLPNNGDHNNGDCNKDMQIKLLQWQVKQTGANNS
jgi:archaellum component FlaC